MNRKELIEFYRTKKYIGDSVYMHFDGYHFILETNNGYSDDPRNRIALEPQVVEKFLALRKKVYEDFEAMVKREREEKKDDV
jgi:hypothetical protein